MLKPEVCPRPPQIAQQIDYVQNQVRELPQQQQISADSLLPAEGRGPRPSQLLSSGSLGKSPSSLQSSGAVRALLAEQQSKVRVG